MKVELPSVQEKDEDQIQERSNLPLSAMFHLEEVKDALKNSDIRSHMVSLNSLSKCSFSTKFCFLTITQMFLNGIY